MLDFTYIYILTAVALLLLLTIVNRSSYFEGRKIRYYRLAILADIAILLGYVGRDLSEQLSELVLAHISNTIIYACAPMSMYFLLLASTKQPNKLTGLCKSLEVLSLVIAISSPFTGLFYTVSPEAIYSRGPLYIYNEALGILFTVVWAISSFREFSYVERIEKFHLSALFALQVAAIVIQGLFSSYKIIYIYGAFSIMIYYAFVIEVYGKYDKLTGARNSLYYHSMIKKNNFPSKYTVIMADANGLKRINDTFGHAAGDELICAAAWALSTAVGKSGSVYRIGGDEFIAVLNTDDQEAAEKIEKGIHDALSRRSSTISGITVSTGMAVHNPRESFSSTVKRADKLMYEHKNEFYAATGIDRRRH